MIFGIICSVLRQYLQRAGRRALAAKSGGWVGGTLSVAVTHAVYAQGADFVEHSRMLYASRKVSGTLKP